MKSIDKLREYTICDTDGIRTRYFDAVEIADEIEAEIADNYMLLPVDADGVPIRPDDLMACTAFDTNDFDGKEHVVAVGDGFWVDKDGCTHIPSETRHVKPRTLEDVLRDVWEEALDYAKSDIWRDSDEVFAERADEIRELLLGGDAEWPSTSQNATKS